MQREFVQELLDGQTGRIKSELAKLQGEAYLKAILALTEYVMPKLQRIDLRNGKADDEQADQEVVRFVILSDGTKIPFN